MPASLADSAIYGALFGDEECSALFGDAAEIAAMLAVEGALAEAQGRLGIIPAEAAGVIAAAANSVTLDPAALRAATALNGVPVPGLIAAFRAHLPQEAAAFVHWGATSQDIVDTALMLRLKHLISIFCERLDGLLSRFADLAQTHAELPMAARTYGQAATPTSLGDVVATWGEPLLTLHDELHKLAFPLSLSGAAGTLSAMGEHGPAVRASMAESLGLTDFGRSWHSDRAPVVVITRALARLAGALGKLGDDLILLTQSGIGEVVLEGAGGSSTMPQKQNPVGPSALVALARQVIGLGAVMDGAMIHRQQRDGAAWFAEWLTLPQLCVSVGAMLRIAGTLGTTLKPVPAAMLRGLDDGLGLIHAEAATFMLAATMTRPEAEKHVKALCLEAGKNGAALPALLARDFPATDWAQALEPAHQLGQAPHDARAFAARIRRKSGG